MRSRLCIATLALAGASAPGPARQAGAPAAASLADAPVVDVTLGRFDPEQRKNVVAKLLQIQVHMRAKEEDAQVSACVTYPLEPVHEALLFVQTGDAPELDSFWAGDTELDRLLEELQDLLQEPGRTVFLRQVAGPRRTGAAWLERHFVRWTAQPRFGKVGAALAAARELTDHVNSGYPELDARAFAEYFGLAGTVWWVFEVADSNAWEDVEGKLLEDATYLGILDRASAAFVEDSFDDRWIGRL